MHRFSRAERRAQRRRIALERRCAHPADCLDCWVCKAPERRPYGCGCSKRRTGQPRRGHGPCGISRDHIYRARQKAAEQRHLILVGVEPDSDAIARLDPR